jgi:predicted DNA-binding transcriptional regulator YafY
LRKPARIGGDDMEVVDALTWRLIETSLRPLLPKVVLDVLEPRLKTAAEKLNAIRARKAVTDWPNKVASELPMVPFVPPEIASGVLRDVQYALIHDYVFTCQYRSISSGRHKSHKLNPLGLLQRGHVTYLVATIHNEDKPLLFALHRMKEVKPGIDTLRRPAGFSLQQFLRDGGGQFGEAKPIRLVLEVSSRLATVLGETRFDAQQVMSPVREGWHRLEATVQHTWQLEWWLLSKLGHLVVLEPEDLRQTIIGLLKRGMDGYGIESGASKTP